MTSCSPLESSRSCWPHNWGRSVPERKNWRISTPEIKQWLLHLTKFLRVALLYFEMCCVIESQCCANRQQTKGVIMHLKSYTHSLMMAEAGPSETTVHLYQTKRSYYSAYSQPCENFKSCCSLWVGCTELNPYHWFSHGTQTRLVNRRECSLYIMCPWSHVEC